MKLVVPEFCLVVLIGASGAGKSSFAKKHFRDTEVISSDHCRALVSDDENDQDATADAFDLLHFIAGKRLAMRRLAVIDATNVRREDRQKLVQLARDHHALPVAIVFDVPEKVCQERNAARPDRNFGKHVVRNQTRSLRQSLKGIRREGFRFDYRLSSAQDVDAVVIERQRLWTDKRDEHGPFDIVGDVHGCFDELHELVRRLGYRIDESDGRYDVTHPDGRRLLFLGDLVDRGPGVTDTLQLVMDTVEAGQALCIPGNHENKLLRKMNGRNVQISHGLAQTLEQLEEKDEAFRERVARFIDRLISHYVLDDGKLVVAHAGMPEAMQGRSSGAVRSFSLYGETSGETDEYGLPVRYNWAEEYRGPAMVVYGHTPVPRAEWLNNTICIDTGCVFGGELTALRYPERELVSVPAGRTYFEPVKPLIAERTDDRSSQQTYDDLLHIDDVRGQRRIVTRLRGNITVREENAAAALEVMSRFAVNPKWLIYLPPTMSPSDTSSAEDLLEHPAEALAYFRNQGVGQVVCQEKHMGSRVVVVVCREPGIAVSRFGLGKESNGAVYTRTGRPFFREEADEQALLARLIAALARTGIWSELATDWLCLDCELMPWSAKAQALLEQQYGPVAAAAEVSLRAAEAALAKAAANGVAVDALRNSYARRLENAERYAAAYRRYCWPVASVADYRLAPFHVLASQGKAHVDETHAWHMAMAARLGADEEPTVQGTSTRTVDLADEASCGAAIAWWSDLTGAGGEGMVVKPMDFVSTRGRDIVQPALKCRGREYLRIIYGPDYTLPENLVRLRQRGLRTKRSLAIREFALGVEALQRFVAQEPLRKVHECVFGVLALESVPVDPRL